MEMVSAGIFGPKLSGKSTLVRVISANYAKKFGMRTICLDINPDERHKWGSNATVFEDEEKFWNEVWQTKGNLIIVDEASTTINRDKELIPVFTRMRHLHHKLIVVGHSGTDLLPAMRRQLDTLYLFRQPRKAAEVWAFDFTDKRLLEAENLRQYEFIYTQLYGTPEKQILKLPTNQK